MHNRNVLLTGLEAGRSDPGAGTGRPGPLSGLQSSYLQTGEGQEGRVPLEDLLLGTDPTHGGSMCSQPNRFPEAPPRNTIALSISFQHTDFGKML